MQRTFGTRYSDRSRGIRNGADGYRRGILRLDSAVLRMTGSLLRPGECLVQPRLATIGGVAMNDAILGRFVDSRNRRANLIGSALWR